MKKRNNFKVIEGLVKVGDKTFNHTWIMKKNKIIDPTFAQFNLPKEEMGKRISLKKYSPKKYVNLNKGELTIYRNVLK